MSSANERAARPFGRLLLSGLLVLLGSYTVLGAGLSCFWSDGDILYTDSHENNRYCITYPAEEEDKNGKVNRGAARHDELDEHDLEGLDGIFQHFGDNDPEHKILSVCIIEMYNYTHVGFTIFGTGSNSMLPTNGIHFYTRCVCKFNYCNEGSTVAEFIAMNKKHMEARHLRN